MTSTVQGAVGAPPPQHYVVLNTQQPRITPAQTAEYSRKNKQTVKGLALTQLMLGIIIFICQTATTIMDVEVTNRAAKIDPQHGSLLPWGLADDAGTGIWVGLWTVLAASVGIAGYRKQTKGLIVTHLILNVFLLIVHIALLGTLSATIESLRFCRIHGIYNGSYRSGYNSYGLYRTTTTTLAPTFLGEEIGRSSPYFHCSHSFFRSWLAIDAVLLVCCLAAFFITLTLVIYNSIAACMCCRKTGCCGSCCYSSPAQGVPAVVYSTQQPVQQFVQPHAVPQLQAAPQYYPQPAPMPFQYVQQPMAPAPAHSGQYPMVMSAPVVTYPAAAAAAPLPAPQPAADNEEGKWEELPPEYSTLAPQSN